MEAKNEFESTLQAIITETFGEKSGDDVYAISNSGMLLSQTPADFDDDLALHLATMMAAIDELGSLKLATVSFHDRGDFMLYRLNERSFLAVDVKDAANGSEISRRLDSVSIEVKERLPWLR